MKTLSIVAPMPLMAPAPLESSSPSLSTAQLLRAASYTLQSLLEQQSPRELQTSKSVQHKGQWAALAAQGRAQSLPQAIHVGFDAAVKPTYGFDLKPPASSQQIAKEASLPVQAEEPEDEHDESDEPALQADAATPAAAPGALDSDMVASPADAAIPQCHVPYACALPTMPYGRFQLHAEDADFLRGLVAMHHSDDGMPPPERPLSPPLPAAGPRFSHAYLHRTCIPEEGSLSSTAAPSLLSTACCTPALLSRATTYSDFGALTAANMSPLGMSRNGTVGDLQALAHHSGQHAQHSSAFSGCATPSSNLTRCTTASDLLSMGGAAAATVASFVNSVAVTPEPRPPRPIATSSPGGLLHHHHHQHLYHSQQHSGDASPSCCATTSIAAASTDCANSDDPATEEHADVASPSTTLFYQTRLLGQGTFADVYLWDVPLPSTCGSVQLACKRVRADCYGARRFKREAEGLMACRGCPFVLHMYGASPAESAPYTMFLEFANKGSVQDLLDYLREQQQQQAGSGEAVPGAPAVVSPSPSASSAAAAASSGLLMPEEHLRWYAVRMLAAVAHVHATGYMHRDIKPANVFLSGRTGAPLLADFDYAEQLPEGGRVRGFAGTLSYAAPEVLRAATRRTLTYGLKADIWSLGVILLQLAGGALPKDGAARPAAPPAGQSPQLFDLLWKGMLAEEEDARLDTAGAMRHAWFADVDWQRIDADEVAPYY